MIPIEEVCWAFYGYETAAGGQLVQEWFNALLQEEKDEALDVLGYLQALPLKSWSLPEYEPRGDGLSEIRFKVAKLKKVYRIYGFFWPEESARPNPPAARRPKYSFLLGKYKKVKNDALGVKEAKRLKGLVERKEATVHAFKFS